jgi:chorismate mutase
MTIFRFNVINEYPFKVPPANLCMEAMRKHMEQELLKEQRLKIDAIDLKIIQLLSERFDIVEEVVDIKKQHNIPSRIERRINEVLSRVEILGQEYALPKGLARDMWAILIDHTCRLEDEGL